ncbi:MAG: HepT-like ribonuclease domain-containing protein, partial [Candidatus Heimdallarchaeaceae archaeon]
EDSQGGYKSMNPKRIYSDYLEDIIESILKIEEFTKDMDYIQFKDDSKTSYAVIRAFEIIGEAAKKIPNEIKSKYANLPWKEIAGMRDKLIHAYFGVNLEVVWKTVIQDIPNLKPLVLKAINEEKISKN